MRNAAALKAALLAAGLALAGCSVDPSKVQLSMPDLSVVADGLYRGSARLLPVFARAEVTVAGGRITDFAILRHFNGQGKPAEALAPRVVERQTIELDAVAGATISSKVILKAGENALRSGLRH